MSSSQGLMSSEIGKNNYGSTSTDNPTVGFAGASSGVSVPGFFDASQFYRLCDDITSNVFSIAKYATTLEKTLKTIGSKNDSNLVRESVHEVQLSVSRICADTTAQIKQLSSLIQRQPQGSGKEEKMRVTRLTSDFRASVQRYTDLQKQIVAKMKVTFLPTVTRTSIGADDDDQANSLVDSDQAQQLAQQELETIEFEQGMMIEREERIRQIESDIVDVNDIMKQLGGMVHEQGEVVDTIEQNIDSAYNEVDGGRQELEKAVSYQTKYRKRLFCLLGTGFVILIIVVIVLVTQLKN